MLNRTAKTEREGRARRATGIEKYNSNVDRRTSQNGRLFSRPSSPWWCSPVCWEAGSR